MFASWQLDPYALVLVLVLGGLYAWGVARVVRRGERWSVGRSAAFCLIGLGAIVVATMSGLAVYNHVLFWPAAVQNIVLDLIGPLGIALGDPLSLAARALPREGRAARRLQGAISGRVLRVLTFPMVSTLLVFASEMLIYFTPYFETALRNDALHELMYLQLLVVGTLFVLPMLTRQDLLPSWCGHPVRAAFIFVDGIVDALPGLVVMTSGTLVAGGWYAAQDRPWGPSLERDQFIGGGAMMTIAELVGLPFIIAVFVEWVRSERLKTAELDARLDRELEHRPAPAPASPVPASVPEPQLTRPWWETDQGIVGERYRSGGG
ncbi:cytochrome c oxidase assembly protein [Streptomyces sp. NPDC057654]|uniref:cytochrome c oxidase assembly protein n=1 Tax=Streptomyces sp. NPDC057654 TaxID=3346196 RepID=UPI003686BA18